MDNPIKGLIERLDWHKNRNVWDGPDDPNKTVRLDLSRLHRKHREHAAEVDKTVELGEALRQAREEKESEQPISMANEAQWPQRETLAVIAWILSKRASIEQAKKIVADAKQGANPEEAVTRSVQEWIEALVPSSAPIPEPLGSLLLSSMDQVEWKDIAARLLELYAGVV